MDYYITIGVMIAMMVFFRRSILAFIDEITRNNK